MNYPRSRVKELRLMHFEISYPNIETPSAPILLLLFVICEVNKARMMHISQMDLELQLKLEIKINL